VTSSPSPGGSATPLPGYETIGSSSPGGSTTGVSDENLRKSISPSPSGVPASSPHRMLLPSSSDTSSASVIVMIILLLICCSCCCFYLCCCWSYDTEPFYKTTFTRWFYTRQAELQEEQEATSVLPPSMQSQVAWLGDMRNRVIAWLSSCLNSITTMWTTLCNFVGHALGWPPAQTEQHRMDRGYTHLPSPRSPSLSPCALDAQSPSNEGTDSSDEDTTSEDNSAS